MPYTLASASFALRDMSSDIFVNKRCVVAEKKGHGLRELF